MNISENTCILLLLVVALETLVLVTGPLVLWFAWLRRRLDEQKSREPHIALLDFLATLQEALEGAWGEQGRELALNALTALIVHMARTDKTSPDRRNQKVGWATDLLLRMIEGQLIGNGRPADYAEVCRRALAILQGLSGVERPVILLVRLALFNGERRLPLNDDRDSQLQTTAKGLLKEIEALSDDTRMWRLLSLFWYHLGVLHAARTRFGQAAQAQRESGRVAELFSDWPGAAVAYFLAALYSLHQVLIDGGSAEKSQAAFQQLEQRYDQLLAAVRNTPLADQWAANGAAHMLQTCVLLGRPDQPRWDEWLGALATAAAKLGTAWQPDLALARAASMAKKSDSGAEAALQAIVGGSDAEERRALALLVLVRRALSEGQGLQAEKLAGQMPKVGAPHVRAVAGELLRIRDQRG